MNVVIGMLKRNANTVFCVVETDNESNVVKRMREEMPGLNRKLV